MRDKNRIKVITDKFNEVWSKSPDLRFCQLYSIIESRLKKEFGVDDVFYIEDHRILMVLNKIEEEWDNEYTK